MNQTSGSLHSKSKKLVSLNKLLNMDSDRYSTFTISGSGINRSHPGNDALLSKYHQGMVQ